MAIFQDFSWASCVRDKDNNIAEFKKINIFYGRNYSGKTTLSRIFRALETGVLSEKFDSPEFRVTIDGGKDITQNTMTNHNQVIRVFNEDFVKENLRFIVDDEDTINSFAILGEGNAKIEKEMKLHESELGSEIEKSGLVGEMLSSVETLHSAQKVYGEKSLSLKDKLTGKANKTGTGIKHNKDFGDANYNINKIRVDIKTVSADTYIPLSTEQVEGHRNFLKEDAKQVIVEPTPFNLSYASFIVKATELVERKIGASEPIQDLLRDSVLETWVREGREHHKGKRSQCAFCSNDLPPSLWEKLDKHFNKESEGLRKQIKGLITSIDSEKTRIPHLLKITDNEFYSKFKGDLKILEEALTTQSITYNESLDSIQKQLKERSNNIFTHQSFIEPSSVEQNLCDVRSSYEQLRKKSNESTKSLNTQQSASRTALRLHEVFIFINDIKYNDECNDINILKKAMDAAKKVNHDAQIRVSDKRVILSALKVESKDESKGAEKVNYYLNNFFGHQALSLKAIENISDGSPAGYRFEVIRDMKKAFHLSEGERSLIAFCYFMARLGDVETMGLQPIIWIDDPVSSLDANHIFFVYSLINSEIVALEKYIEEGKTKERERFKQLFISTHNLDFLKYIKRLPGASSKNKSQYFIINRVEQRSYISLMPRYLKDYVTEFNYLFHQIYKCAHAQIEGDEDHDCYYNFGNNARKFLEAFLYFKYPNASIEDKTKLARFFGDDVFSSSLTDRINNEYSHLAGVLERSVLPIDVPEMKVTANFILQKIKERDLEQYLALLQSIGIENDHEDIH